MSLPLAIDWRDPLWQQALLRALQESPEITIDSPDEAERIWVYCSCPAQPGEHLHHVEWLWEGLTCDCPSPCAHRVRAWAEFMGEWRTLVRIAREHGAQAAIRWLLYDQTGELDVTPLRPLRDVRMWREDGRAHADIPHYVRHSTAFEWGYLGSGPSDLAFSILSYFYGPAVAEALYHDFKFHVIARIPRDAREYVLPAEQIADWVEAAAREVPA